MRVSVVKFHRKAFSSKFDQYFIGLFRNPGQFFFSFIYRNNNHMDRSKFRRQYQTVVIRVGHNQGSHQTGTYTPRCPPDIIQASLLCSEFHIKCLGKILSKEMGSACLQGFSILHHGLYTIGVFGTGKSFIDTLDPSYYR